jgi:hypothetical protein
MAKMKDFKWKCGQQFTFTMSHSLFWLPSWDVLGVAPYPIKGAASVAVG